MTRNSCKWVPLSSFICSSFLWFSLKAHWALISASGWVQAEVRIGEGWNSLEWVWHIQVWCGGVDLKKLSLVGGAEQRKHRWWKEFVRWCIMKWFESLGDLPVWKLPWAHGWAMGIKGNQIIRVSSENKLVSYCKSLEEIMVEGLQREPSVHRSEVSSKMNLHSFTSLSQSEWRTGLQQVQSG